MNSWRHNFVVVKAYLHSFYWTFGSNLSASCCQIKCNMISKARSDKNWFRRFCKSSIIFALLWKQRQRMSPLKSWKHGEDQSSCPYTFRRPLEVTLGILGIFFPKLFTYNEKKNAHMHSFRYQLPRSQQELKKRFIYHVISYILQGNKVPYFLFIMT